MKRNVNASNIFKAKKCITIGPYWIDQNPNMGIARA